MLAKVAPPTNDFGALARYLVHGKPGTTPDPKRVAWMFMANLPTDDPMLAAKLMHATAERSARTKNAAYHLMIAWEAAENPTPEQMQDIARRTLELAGLAEHEALVMGHADKPHPHLHILLNRVHTGTGKAWKTSHDYARFDAIMKQLADEHGFRHVPTHMHNAEATVHLPKKPNSRATYAGKRGAATTRTQWSREAASTFGATLSERIDRASSTDDIANAIAEHGMKLEAKGKGFVIGNAQSYAKLSALNLTTSAREGLLSAFAPKPKATLPIQPPPALKLSRHIFDVDAIDIVRAFIILGLADKSDLHAAIDDAAAVRAEQISKRPLMEQLLNKLMATTAQTQPRRAAKIRRPSRPTSPSRSR